MLGFIIVIFHDNRITRKYIREHWRKSLDLLDRERGQGSRDQSPIRSGCFHWRNSPLNPMLSATRKLAMTHRSISSLDFGSVAVWEEGLLGYARQRGATPGAMTSPRRLAKIGSCQGTCISYVA